MDDSNQIPAASTHEPLTPIDSQTNRTNDDDDEEEYRSGPVSAEPSAILIVSPRTMYSQMTLESSAGVSGNVEELVLKLDDTTQSSISIRVSRGKSRVNLADPSRPYRRAPPKRIQRGDSSPVVVRLQNLQRVKFKSNEQQQSIVANATEGACIVPGDMILPASVFQQPVERLKSMYDFYSPGQNAETIRDKIEKLKARMVTMRQALMKTKQSCIFDPAAAATMTDAGSSDMRQTVAPMEQPAPTIDGSTKTAEETDEESKSGTSAPEEASEGVESQNYVVGVTGAERTGPDTGTDDGDSHAK